MLRKRVWRAKREWAVLMAIVAVLVGLLAGMILGRQTIVYEVGSSYKSAPGREVNCHFARVDDLSMCSVYDEVANMRCDFFWPRVGMFCEPIVRR